MRTLILNSSNIVEGTNNSVLEFEFVGGNVNLVKGQKVSLASIQMYYSTFNITSAYGNNVFNYTWVDGTSHQVLFPDGFYDADGINNYLHFVMLQNKHYLIDPTGDYVWFITFSPNPTRYAIEVNCFNMNATLYPIGVGQYAYPVGATWVVPTNNIVPMLQVLTNSFRQIIGFEAGYYPQGAPTYAQAVIAGVPPAQTQTPTYTSTQTFLSTTIPQITPFSSFVVNCSLVNNNYAVPNSLIYSFSPQGTFGEQFTIAPNEYIFIDVLPAQYNRFRIFFTDQDNRPISILDPNMIIQILISDPTDNLSLQTR
jgi:hypothetical protein